MKKTVLVLMTLVAGFLLTSCGNSQKKKAIDMFNNFFDKEEAFLNNVNDADAMLEYYNASDARFTEFFAQLDEKFPINENDELIGFSKQDSDDVLAVYNKRLEQFKPLRATKASELVEPYLSDAENAFVNLLALYYDDEQPAEDVAIQAAQEFEEKYNLAERYEYLCDEEQLDRFYEMFHFVYGDEEEDEQ